VHLITFAFENLSDMYGFIEQHGKQSFHHLVVGFIAQQPFDGIVE
jgi:hypothetical protein